MTDQYEPEGRLSRLRSHRLSLESATPRPSIDVRERPSDSKGPSTEGAQGEGWLSSALRYAGLGGSGTDLQSTGETSAAHPAQPGDRTNGTLSNTGDQHTSTVASDDAAGGHNVDPVQPYEFPERAGDVPARNAEGDAADNSIRDKITGLVGGKDGQGDPQQPASPKPIVSADIHHPEKASREVKKLETEDGEQPLAATRASDPAAAVNTDVNPNNDQVEGSSTANGSTGYLGGALASAGAAATGAAAYVKDAVAGGSNQAPGPSNYTPDSSYTPTGTSITPAADRQLADKKLGHSHSASGQATVSPLEAEKTFAGSPADPTEHAHPSVKEGQLATAHEHPSFGGWANGSESSKARAPPTSPLGQGGAEHRTASNAADSNRAASATSSELHGTLSDLRPTSAFAAHSHQAPTDAADKKAATSTTADATTGADDKAKAGCCGFGKKKKSKK